MPSFSDPMTELLTSSKVGLSLHPAVVSPGGRSAERYSALVSSL